MMVKIIFAEIPRISGRAKLPEYHRLHIQINVDLLPR